MNSTYLSLKGTKTTQALLVQLVGTALCPPRGLKVYLYPIEAGLVVLWGLVTGSGDLLEFLLEMQSPRPRPPPSTLESASY